MDRPSLPGSSNPESRSGSSGHGDLVGDGSSILHSRLAWTASPGSELRGHLVFGVVSVQLPLMTSSVEQGEPDPGGGNNLVGLHSLNGTDTNQQELIVPLERFPAGPRALTVVFDPLNSTDDMQQELARPDEANPAVPFEANSAGGEFVEVGQLPQNRADGISRGLAMQVEMTEDVQQEHAVPVEPNPTGGENLVVVRHPPSRTDNTQHVLPMPFETRDDIDQEFAMLVELNRAGGESVVDGMEDNTDQELAMRLERNPAGDENYVVWMAENVQQEVDIPVEQNPAGGENAVVGRADNVQQEVAMLAEQNRVQGETAVVGQNPLSSADDFQVRLPSEDTMKSQSTMTKQREKRVLQEDQIDDGECHICPICMEPWTNMGEHRICSLACGHLFGKSCIKRWLRQAGRKSSRCPHCNKRAKWEDLRNLYVPRIEVVDGEMQQLAQEVCALRAENLRLKSENEKLQEKIRQNKGKMGLVQAPALQFVPKSSVENRCTEVKEASITTTGSETVQSLRNRVMSSLTPSLLGPGPRPEVDARNLLANSSSKIGCNGFKKMFHLQSELRIHGGKVFDMDGESLTVIFSNRNEGTGGDFGLSKASLLSCTEIEKIGLPPGFGAIRDIRLSPFGVRGTGRCAMVASSSKKLSLISLESNNIVLTYSVQSPPWSCAWDPSVPNLVYSGLQNGALLVLDLRQTSSPIAMLNGPVNRPVHSLQVIQAQSPVQSMGSREILTGSSSGILLWNVDSSATNAGSRSKMPKCVFSDTGVVCISLTYEHSINTGVASFRQSPLAQTEPSSFLNPGSSAEQSSSRPSDGPIIGGPSSVATSCEEPSHWIFGRRQGFFGSQTNESINYSEFRFPWEKGGVMVGNKCQSLMPRSAIISQSKAGLRSKTLFACGDERTNSVWLWDMKSFRLTDTLAPHQSPVLDLKNVHIHGTDMLGCVSEQSFQIYKRSK